MFVTYGNALLLLFELADRGDPRFEQAAARWHARFALEASLPLAESTVIADMLGGAKGRANRHVLRSQLLRKVERAGLASADVPAG
jgi:hypothetical protein